MPTPDELAEDAAQAEADGAPESEDEHVRDALEGDEDAEIDTGERRDQRAL